MSLVHLKASPSSQCPDFQQIVCLAGLPGFVEGNPALQHAVEPQTLEPIDRDNPIEPAIVVAEDTPSLEIPADLVETPEKVQQELPVDATPHYSPTLGEIAKSEEWVVFSKSG